MINCIKIHYLADSTKSEPMRHTLLRSPSQQARFATASTKNRPSREAAEKVECFFSPENLIIEMIPDFVLFGIIFSILARLFLSKCAF